MAGEDGRYRMRHWMFAFGLAILGGAAQPTAAQQPWPAKPIRLILPNAPGSGPDFLARMLGEHLSRAVGQQWVIDNRPGADGIIAAEAVAKAGRDGYTYAFGSQEILAVTPRLRKALPYDAVNDFTTVALIAEPSGFAIVAAADVPARTLPELIALAKSQPGKLSYSTTVRISSLFAEWLKKNAVIQMVEVPYKATTQAIQDALAGRLPLMVTSLTAVEGHIKAGKLRALAVTSPSRMPGWDLVPTVAETFPGFEMGGWITLMAPSGTSMDIVRRLNREISIVLKNPDYSQKAAQTGWYNLGGARTPEEAAEFVRRQREQWTKIIDDVGIKPE